MGWYVAVGIAYGIFILVVVRWFCVIGDYNAEYDRRLAELVRRLSEK